jgi:hypothetical protein
MNMAKKNQFGKNNCMFGKHHTEEAKQKIRLSKLAEKNPMWKGDSVGLSKLHVWVKSRKPKSKLCECCNKEKSYDLANISGKYTRDINDYEWLCRSCHMHKDGRINNLKQFKSKGVVI